MISEPTIREALALPAEAEETVRRITGTVVAQFEKLTGFKYTRKVGEIQLFQTKGRHTVLHLSRRPVETFTKLEQRAKTDPAWVTMDAGLYFQEGSRIECLAGYFSAYMRATYTAGYIEGATGLQTETPADIKTALITQAQFVLTRTGLGMIAAKQQVVGKTSALLETADYHPLFMATAEKYRHG